MKLTDEKVRARVGGVWDASEIRKLIRENPELIGAIPRAPGDDRRRTLIALALLAISAVLFASVIMSDVDRGELNSWGVEVDLTPEM